MYSNFEDFQFEIQSKHCPVVQKKLPVQFDQRQHFLQTNLPL